MPTIAQVFTCSLRAHWYIGCTISTTAVLSMSVLADCIESLQTLTGVLVKSKRSALSCKNLYQVLLELLNSEQPQTHALISVYQF